MSVKPLRSDLVKYLEKHNLTKKFNKQLELFKNNSRHPSLHTEAIGPKNFDLHSFRINRQYRVIFGISGGNKIEIVDINDHYQ